MCFSVDTNSCFLCSTRQCTSVGLFAEISSVCVFLYDASCVTGIVWWCWFWSVSLDSVRFAAWRRHGWSFVIQHVGCNSRRGGWVECCLCSAKRSPDQFVPWSRIEIVRRGHHMDRLLFIFTIILYLPFILTVCDCNCDATFLALNIAFLKVVCAISVLSLISLFMTRLLSV